MVLYGNSTQVICRFTRPTHKNQHKIYIMYKSEEKESAKTRITWSIERRCKKRGISNWSIEFGFNTIYTQRIRKRNHKTKYNVDCDCVIKPGWTLKYNHFYRHQPQPSSFTIIMFVNKWWYAEHIWITFYCIQALNTNCNKVKNRNYHVDIEQTVYRDNLQKYTWIFNCVRVYV